MIPPCLRKRYNILLLCVLFLPGSCTKWVTVPPPVTQVTADGAFSNDATAGATVAGLYSQIMSGSLQFLNGATTLYPALSADELYRTTPDASADPFTANALSSQNSILAGDLWGKGYSYIYQINACLEGLAAAGGVSEGARQELSGEALFMRALSYFYLTNLFGEVPLELSTAYTTNASLPRADTGSLYHAITADLLEAKEKLRHAVAASPAVRPSYAACTALLARVYLYRRYWSAAAAEADTVINSGAFALEDLSSVFLSGSRETVFALVPVIPGINTAEGLNFIPYDSTVVPTYALQPSLVNAFEPGDGRKAAWTDNAFLNGTLYRYPYKYKVRGGDAIVENYTVLRLAELYLIRAEAGAEEGDLTGAVSDVNAIRTRAGLPPLSPNLSKEELLDHIRQENRIEFCFEWGHRWLDLKRTGTADAVLAPLKSGWKSSDTLYPIPYSQLLLNPNLTQNAGY